MMWFTPTGSLANGDEHMRDTSAHDNLSATRTFVDDAPGNPFRTSHLPWNLEFDPAVAPTTTRVDLGEPWVVGCRVGRMSGRRRAPEIRNTQGEYAAVLMVHSGTEILTQQGRTTGARPYR